MGRYVALGELQQMVMLAVVRLGREAYGPAVQDELRRVVNRQLAVPTVYNTLVRLEDQGLVASTEAPAAGGRGGRARRVFRLTPSGWDALSEARTSMDRLWDGVVRP